jgi:radical SAM protein with 4Fe4S-binding SPASM domain
VQTPPIKQLFLEITNKCFLYCKHCSSEASILGQESLSTGEIKLLIEETKPYGLEYLALSGGEPLCHEGVLEVIHYATENNITTCVYTSGILKEQIHAIPVPSKILKDLYHAGLKTVIFSLHGASQEIYEKITGVPGSFPLVIKSILEAVKTGLDVQVHCVPMRINLHECVDLIDFVGGLGVKKISFLRLVPQGRAENNLELYLTNDDASILWALLYNHKSYHDVEVRFGAPFNCFRTEPGGTVCTAGLNKLLISPNGECFPCEAFKFMKCHMKTIKNQKVMDIWRSDVILSRLRTITHTEIEQCSICSHISICGGGCPGQRLIANGNLEVGPDPWCKKFLTHDSEVFFEKNYA